MSCGTTRGLDLDAGGFEGFSWLVFRGFFVVLWFKWFMVFYFTAGPTRRTAGRIGGLVSQEHHGALDHRDRVAQTRLASSTRTLRAMAWR